MTMNLSVNLAMTLRRLWYLLKISRTWTNIKSNLSLAQIKTEIMYDICWFIQFEDLFLQNQFLDYKLQVACWGGFFI